MGYKIAYELNRIEPMKTKIAIVALTLLASSPSFAQDQHTSSMVACESIELYDSVGGDFEKANKAGFGGIDKCRIIIDSTPPYTNLTHIEKSEGDYLCVRAAYANEPRWPHCYWIDGRKLRNIGHGSQLSDEQFAEVERLFAEQIKLRKIENDYWDRADDLIYDGDKYRHLDSSQKRQVDEFKALALQTQRQWIELQHQIMKIIER
jgi:hypothetical protein